MANAAFLIAFTIAFPLALVISMKAIPMFVEGRTASRTLREAERALNPQPAHRRPAVVVGVTVTISALATAITAAVALDSAVWVGAGVVAMGAFQLTRIIDRVDADYLDLDAELRDLIEEMRG